PAARAARSGDHLRRPRETVRHRRRVHGGARDQGRQEGSPQGGPERRRPRRPRPHGRARRLGGGAGGFRSGAPAERRGPGRRRRLCRPARPVRRRPDLRGPSHHMNAKARQELIGIGALVVGLFLGLTLLRLPVTGSWGDHIGSLLWRTLGAGSAVLPLLGILTVGWHPLVALRTRETEVRKRDAGSGMRDVGKARQKASLPEGEPRIPHPPSRIPTRSKPTPPASRIPHLVPAGVLIPPIDLLNPAPPEDGEAGLVQIEQMGRKLIETLQTFRVEGSIAGRTVGPVVTQYEVAPGPGVKVGRIAALADDLALAMRAPSLRIVAPIPGKAAVGIEVPNPIPRMVHVRELIEGADYQRANRALPLGLGKNLEGEPVIADLAKMPHLLIAGVTGSGKSVCINTIITSLIYTHPPDRLKLLMIDPKMVELSMYEKLPHLGLPVVTNHHKAASVLKWAVWEMERRYRLLHANHARNIVDFNHKVEQGKSFVDAGTGEVGRGTGGSLIAPSPVPRPPSLYSDGVVPYIVLIVDELADLMLTVQGEIETPLATLAQKARAIGIHLVLATQRPSVNV